MNKGQKNILAITLIIMLGITLCSIRLYQIANIPKILLNGNKTITMNLYETYNEEGAQAYRNKEDISNELKIEGNIDTNKPGNYEITYTIDNHEITRNVIVKDNVSPILTINGAKELIVGLNTEYIDEGAKAEDNIDGDITNKIEVSGTVDTTTIGEYKITDIDLKDGVKLMLGDKMKLLVRPSGTEPLLRIYFEADENEKLKKLKQEVEKKLL